MSYCRWSSDGFRSDVYTYAHVDGTWTTHVAGRRRVGLHAFEDIDLPHVGETFKDATPQACADTLRILKGLGYRVPDGVIETLDSEQLEAEHG